MSAITVSRPVREGQFSTGSTGSTRSKRTVVAVAVLVAVSFLIVRATTHHTATSTPLNTLSSADAAQIAGDVAPSTAKLSSADAAQIAGDGATLTSPVTTKLSPANAAQITGGFAPSTQQFSQATTVSCRVGQPC